MTSIKKKNIVYGKFIRARRDEEKATLYNQFKTYQNIINKLTKISKGKHYRKYFNEHKKNMLKTWNGIKSIININRKKKKDKFFTTIVEKTENKILQMDKKYSDFLDNPLEKTFFLIPTEPNEVQSLIKTLNLKKSYMTQWYTNKTFKGI